MLYIQESGSIRSPINAEAFPLVYSLLSLFVTQSEAYTNIGVAPESACAKSTKKVQKFKSSYWHCPSGMAYIRIYTCKTMVTNDGYK